MFLLQVFFCLTLVTNPNFKKVDVTIEKAIKDRAFPSAAVLVSKNRKILYAKAFGKFTYNKSSTLTTIETIYDLASLTKPLATLYTVMKLYEQGKIELDAPVSRYIPEFAVKNKAGILVKHLLLHNSGLAPFRRYSPSIDSYKDVVMNMCNETLQNKPGKKTVYSDINFFLLAEVVSRIVGKKPFDNQAFYDFFKESFLKPLKLTNTFFNPPKSVEHRIAPTNKPKGWKRKKKRPLVNDPTAAVAGGIAGNAGLFSSIYDVAKLAHLMISSNVENPVFKSGTIKTFTKKITRRTLGWDMKTSSKSASGKYLSYKTFGHLGYTGTSVWIDPTRNLVIIFLTNRVFPSTKNKKIRKIRPLVHNAIMECLEPEIKVPLPLK